MKATRYAEGLNKGIFWLISLALLLALVLPSDSTGIAQASPGTKTLRPNAVGDECNIPSQSGCSACPDHYTCVDEDSSDGDATYVFQSGSKTDYYRDLYNIDGSVGSGVINFIKVYAVAKGRTPIDQASLKLAIKTGGTAYESGEITVTSSYATYSYQWDTNPQTGNPWTWGDIDALQIGVALRDPKALGAVRETRTTQVYVEVHYTPELFTAIQIRAQDYSTAVSAITFPEGAPGATVSTPYNDADGSGSPQAFGTPGTPVVTLFNGGSVTYTIWYNITTFTNNIVSSENYLINDKGAACTSADSITNAVTFGEDTTTTTTIAAGAGNEKDLYLKITLSDVAGKTGISTLTILGEA